MLNAVKNFFSFIVGNKYVVSIIYLISFVATLLFIYKFYSIREQYEKKIYGMEKTVEALRGDIESTREVYRTVLLKVNDVDAKYNQRMNEIDSVYREELERAIQSFYKKVVSLSSSNGNIEEKLLILGFGELK